MDMTPNLTPVEAHRPLRAELSTDGPAARVTKRQACSCGWRGEWSGLDGSGGEQSSLTRHMRDVGVVGSTMTGRDVTTGTTYTGTVSEAFYVGAHDVRYRLTDTGRAYDGGRPIRPIVHPS